MVFSFSTPILAQEKGISSKEFIANESKSEELNRIYASSAYSESEDIFGDRKELFSATFTSMILDLNQYLHSEGFEWNQEVAYTFKFYIGENGKIDHLIYQFHNGIVISNEDQFGDLLNVWINYYRFPLKAPGPFRHYYASKFKPSSKH